eukprot:4361085-Amphidinium_carterae.1
MAQVFARCKADAAENTELREARTRVCRALPQSKVYPKGIAYGLSLLGFYEEFLCLNAIFNGLRNDYPTNGLPRLCVHNLQTGFVNPFVRSGIQVSVALEAKEQVEELRAQAKETR